MTNAPFSQVLRDRTTSGHGNAEHSGFMHDLVGGNGTREDYVALAAQQYYIYKALEDAAQTMAQDPVAGPFVIPELARVPSIEADLAFLIGDDWAERVRPLPATQRYADRIREQGEAWSGGFVAHHYTRYLGDLSGGQIIRTLIQRQFGFDRDGVRFYLFDGIEKPKRFKDHYRELLDQAAWAEPEHERIIDEVAEAYRLNTAVFVELEEATRSFA